MESILRELPESSIKIIFHRGQLVFQFIPIRLAPDTYSRIDIPRLPPKKILLCQILELLFSSKAAFVLASHANRKRDEKSTWMSCRYT